MADNKTVRDGDNASFVGAADELSDSSFSPKVTLLDGSGSPAPISPATLGSIGATNEAAAGTDTATSGLNGLIKRLLQKFTTQLPAALGAQGALKVEGVSNGTVVPIVEPSVSSATLSSLASDTTSAQLLASTATRKGLILVNTDAFDAYIKYGTTASATDFTAIIPANGGYWEMPRPIYTGRIDAIWAGNGSGKLYATES